jgi:hypothetical protein
VRPCEGVASTHLLHIGVEELSHAERKRSVKSVQSVQGIEHNFVFVGGKSFPVCYVSYESVLNTLFRAMQLIIFPVSRSKANEAFSVSGQLGNNILEALYSENSSF